MVALVASTPMLFSVPTWTHADNHCQAALELTGDQELVERVKAKLPKPTTHAGATRDECRPVSTHLKAWEGGILLSIQSEEQGKVHRTATTAEEAAIVIQSWAEHDLTDPLLRPRKPQRIQPARVSTVAAEEPLPSLVLVSPELDDDRRIHVGASATFGFGNDQSVWSGARLQACIDIRGICVGGIADYANDLRLSGEAERAESTRESLALLFSAEKPTTVAGINLSPGVAVGQGRLSAISKTANETIEDDTFMVIARGYIKSVAPLGASWSVVGEAAIDYRPLGKRNLAKDEDAALPGSVPASAWLSLGLRYEGL